MAATILTARAAAFKMRRADSRPREVRMVTTAGNSDAITFDAAISMAESEGDDSAC